VNFGEGLGAVLLEFGLEALDAKFFASGVGALDKAVGVESEDAAGFGFDGGAGEIAFGEDAEGHVGGFVLDDVVGARGEMEDGGMAGDAETKAVARFARKQKVTNMSGILRG
jgi:hypothetical protein